MGLRGRPAGDTLKPVPMEPADLRRFEDLAHLAPPVLQQALARVTDAPLAQVFQGLDPEVAKALFANLSERRRALVLIERQRCGLLTEDAVLAARLNVLKQARGLTPLPLPLPSEGKEETPPPLAPEEREKMEKRRWSRALARLQEQNPELRRLAEERKAIVLAAFLRSTMKEGAPEEPKSPGRPK